MTMPTILAATWRDGLFVFVGETRRQELAGQSVRALEQDQDGSVLAIVDGLAVCRRTREGTWTTLAKSELDLACMVVVGDVIYLGTDDAQVLRINQDGKIDPLHGFQTVPGREKWYAGTAQI